MRLSMRLRTVPGRLAAGAYVLHSGLEKWNADEERAIGTHGMAEGDFVRNYYRVHDARTGDRLVDKSYSAKSDHVHYGADEQMIADIFAHLTDGAALHDDGKAQRLFHIQCQKRRVCPAPGLFL